MPNFSIIAAVDAKNGLGRAGQLPWRLAADMAFFKKTTLTTQDPQKTNAVIMGRVTWESLPERFRPLPGRVNCVLSRQQGLALPPGVRTAASLDAALSAVRDDPAIEQVFVIGGAAVYERALAHPECAKIYLTRLKNDFHCDVFFPEDLSEFEEIACSPVQKEGEVCFCFSQWQRRSSPEKAAGPVSL